MDHFCAARFRQAVCLQACLTPCLLVAGMAAAQESAAIPPPPVITAAPPRAIDSLLVEPVADLTPEQIAGMQRKLTDWPQLGRYRAADAALPPASKDRVVFMGDSITDGWPIGEGRAFFSEKPYLNRGISGQTTAQMVVRFQQDVVALKPAAVVILAGINDIAGNTGEASLAMIEDNLKTMVEVAHANHIRVVLSSVLPAIDFPWRRGLQPADKVRELNQWLRQYAATSGCVYLDYYSSLADAEGGMKPGLSKDNVHPTTAGYAVMAPLAQTAIDRSLAMPAP